jgi:iron complex outermembrane receptor protein
VGGYIRENVPNSYRAGIELQFGTRLLTNLEWSANATFSQNKIDEYQRFLDDFDSGGQQSETYTDVDIAFSPSRIANSILSYTPGSFTAEWTMKYVSRQYLDNTQTKARSIDPYLVNDLRFSYSLDDLSFVQNVTASLQINNILNEEYVSNGYTFGWISGGEERFFNYYYPQAGRNILANVKIGF